MELIMDLVESTQGLWHFSLIWCGGGAEFWFLEQRGMAASLKQIIAVLF